MQGKSRVKGTEVFSSEDSSWLVTAVELCCCSRWPAVCGLHKYDVPRVVSPSIEQQHTPNHVLVEPKIPSCHFALLARYRPNIKVPIFLPSPIENWTLFLFQKKETGRKYSPSFLDAGKKIVYKRGAAILREISKRKCSLENRPTLLYVAYPWYNDVCALSGIYGANYCATWRHRTRVVMRAVRILQLAE